MPSQSNSRFRGKGTELVLLMGIAALAIAHAVAFGREAAMIFLVGALSGIWSMMFLSARDEARNDD